MRIQLTQPLASNAPADASDVIQVKKMLNRLGYYIPSKDIGITGIPDRAMFDGLKAFQAEQNLSPTGELRPDDKTQGALNDEGEKQKKYKIQYEWRTVGDKKVRKSHAALDGDIRIAGERLDPGEDPGCRCWMVNVRRVRDCSEEKAAYEEAKQRFDALDQQKAQIERELKDIAEKLDDIDEAVIRNWIITAASGMLIGVRGAITGEVVEEVADRVQEHLSQKRKEPLKKRDKLIEQLKRINVQWNKASHNVTQAEQDLEQCLQG